MASTTHVARVLLPKAGPLFALATVLVAGVSAGGFAKRLGIPRVTGQILVGILMGPSVLGLFSEKPLHLLEPITAFALALMTMTVGSHLDFKRVRAAGRRLFSLMILEALLTPTLVVAALHLGLGVSLELSILLGVLAVSTAPATIVALVKETRAKGVFVNTLLAAVALNNISCIALYEIAHGEVRLLLTHTQGITLLDLHLMALKEILACVALGGLAGAGLIWITRGVSREDKKTTHSLIALLATAGIASYFDYSPLLATLFLGVALVNIAPHHEGIGDRVFVNFEEAILCVFFTMAGMHLDFSYLGQAGVLAATVALLRLIGKQVSAWSAMRLAGATEGVTRYLGLALVPQAGVAIGLLILTSSDPVMAPLSDLLLATGVTMVAINEILGPILTRQALRWSGDAGKDRARLIDFLHEEHIRTDLEAGSKEEAIETLVDMLVRTHRPGIDREALLESVLQREAESSTCLGQGLFVPHGVLAGDGEMVGVMGLNRGGLPFETPDGKPVQCIVLLATPETDRERHVEVLAALARIVRNEEARELLFHALSPAHAHVTLHDKEFEEYNYFLEEMDHF